MAETKSPTLKFLIFFPTSTTFPLALYPNGTGVSSLFKDILIASEKLVCLALSKTLFTKSGLSIAFLIMLFLARFIIEDSVPRLTAEKEVFTKISSSLIFGSGKFSINISPDE